MLAQRKPSGSRNTAILAEASHLAGVAGQGDIRRNLIFFVQQHLEY